MRILLWEDQAPTRAGIRLALPADGFEIEETATLGHALAFLATETADVVLLGGNFDVETQAAIRALRVASPESRIVVLAAAPPQDSRAGVIAAFDAGAVGWLRKDVSPERLPALLRAVCDGERIVPRSLVGALMQEIVEWRRHAPDVKVFPNGASLTTRELEVLERVAAGGTTSYVARQLQISDVTVRRHLSDAVKKLGVEDRGAAARLFRSVQAEWAGSPIDDGSSRVQPEGRAG